MTPRVHFEYIFHATEKKEAIGRIGQIDRFEYIIRFLAISFAIVKSRANNAATVPASNRSISNLTQTNLSSKIPSIETGSAARLSALTSRPSCHKH